MNEINEKVAVNDIMADLHTAINMSTYSIQHATNEDFRNILITERDHFETIAYDLYKIAKAKGYYEPAAPAGEADIEQVRKIVSKEVH